MNATLIKPEQGTIGIPAERLHQLRAIAKHRNTTIVGVIEDAIAKAIEAGEIPDTLEGFASVFTDDDILVLTIRDEVIQMPRKRGLVLAVVLEAAAGKVDPEIGFGLQVGKGGAFDLGGGMKLGVGRHAKAVLLSIVDEAGAVQMKTATTPSITLDLARIIRQAVVTQ